MQVAVREGKIVFREVTGVVCYEAWRRHGTMLALHHE